MMNVFRILMKEMNDLEHGKKNLKYYIFLIQERFLDSLRIISSEVLSKRNLDLLLEFVEHCSDYFNQCLPNNINFWDKFEEYWKEIFIEIQSELKDHLSLVEKLPI